MESRLQIRRVTAQYLVPANHPSPERIKERLDRELSAHLPSTLSGALSSWFPDADPSIWFVRRVHIDLAVNTTWTSGQLTRVITSNFGRSLGATLDDSAGRDNVVHFSDRAAYLASFVQDLAAGHAWTHWYYESFNGLSMLSTSAALRTAICDQPAPGREALIRLSTAELQDVLRALNRQEADLVLSHLAGSSSHGDEAGCCEMVWQAWRSIAPRTFQLDRSQQALLLYLTASRNGELIGLNLKRAALSLLCFADRLASDSAAERARLLAALTSGSLAAVYQAAGTDAELLTPLLQCSPDWLREVAGSINQHASASGESTEGQRRYTSFGGAFLLLPHIDQLPLPEACSAFPHADEAAAISMVRFLLLIKCCGQRNAERAFNDPLLRDLLLIPPAVSLDVVREWVSRIAVEDVQHFLHTLLEFQRKQGSITHHEHVLFRSDEGITLIDANRGLWILVESCEQDSLVDVLKVPLSELESNGGVLSCDGSLLPKLSAEFADLSIRDLTHLESETDQLRGVLARLDKVPSELEHLALPGFHLSTRVDLALSMAAQHVMRAFAWQLPSFGQSNLLYLWTNFLELPASLEEEPGRRVVRLGRPPLRMVLGFTGAMRQTYSLSWLDERPVTLFEDT